MFENLDRRSDARTTRRQSTLSRWLVESAYPLWAEYGVDRHQGGFYERLDFGLKAIEEPRRARLVSRQIYCFSVSAELGWQGDADGRVQHGIDFLCRHLLQADGTVIMAVNSDGSSPRHQYDPYDYAFVLFGLAAAARNRPNRLVLQDIASKVRDRLVSGWSHPEIGFEEARPRRLPLKANPHMHLFEAFLSWAEIAGANDQSWQGSADRIAELALSRLISQTTGALYEFFDGDWNPMPDADGLVIEPGHQFEWSWLLSRWSAIKNDPVAFAAALRLAEIGETYGIDDRRGVAVNSLDQNFKLRDGDAKLWPQTERIKAWHALSTHPLNSSVGRASASRHINMAIDGLLPFLTDEPKGLWHEVMRADGTFVVEPVRASSLYHIVCAIQTLSSVIATAEEVT